jgi:NAD(P)-dependent dehydrogenase (short-subunit alcohol dehydrogenase family)
MTGMPGEGRRPGLGLLSLEGRTALVTGAGGGLGRQMALGLAEAGADLVICGRRADALERSAELISAFGVSVRAVPADITEEADVVRLGEAAGPIDILLNNAGIGPNQHWQDVPLSEWRKAFALNVDAQFRLIQLFAPGMMERQWGRIINVASVYGKMGGNPDLYPGLDWDVPSYFASKHAVHGVTHYLAPRLAKHGVTINSLSPGGFAGSEQNEASGMGSDEMLRVFNSAVPAGRMGGADDLKAAAVFLASPGSAYFTGQDLVVDGGWTVW